tara:strand:- start:87 stop:521 length:435 start_codon:yes stop_codon:yes gene_type:complete
MKKIIKNVHEHVNLIPLAINLLLVIIITLATMMPASAQDRIIKIPESELEQFFLAIDTLKQSDSLKTILIEDLEVQLSNYYFLNQKNESILLVKDEEIVLLSSQIKLYDDRLKITDAWYNKRWFGVVIGVVGTSTAIYLAGQIN